jgi:taurine---2-oxoglutarate transaminase
MTQTQTRSHAESAPVNQADDSHVFYSWSAQSAIKPMLIVRAQGSHVFDAAGKDYLDFSCQLVNTNIGHQHPKVVAAIKAQADLLCTVSPLHANATRNEAARLICELAPEAMNQVLFTCDGSEAVEHATRLARLHTGRIKLLSTYRSYHGSTTTATNLTGEPRRWPNDYGSTGTGHFFGPFLYRSPFHSSSEEEESARALEHLEQVVGFEGPSTIAAVVIETVPGTAGIMPPPPGYLAGVRDICHRHGIVFITDEVMAGFGRTGKWFAFENYGVVPDLITFAKGVNSGYVPLGGVIISDEIAASFDERVGEARGLGVFWALDLVKDKATREPIAPYGGSSPAMADLLAACKKGGLLPFMQFNRIHAVPPCNVSEAEAKEGIAILDEALVAADAYCTS